MERNHKLKVLSVVGARPNFMKIAPLCHAIRKHNESIVGEGRVPIEHVIVHTGQHYDDKMSANFFQDLGIEKPSINLNIGSGTHAEQVGKTMIAFEKVLHEVKPDWVIVVGDVNATCACSITAKKECVKLAHIEAGLRSGDITMPEEINRLVTDRLSDLLFTPDQFSGANLLKEGIMPEKIRFVGNIMIDTLEMNRVKAQSLDTNAIVKNSLISDQCLDSDLAKCPFGILTLHRPSNVDNVLVIKELVNFIDQEASVKMPIIWPIHPRTRKQLESLDIFQQVLNNQNLFVLEPIGYLEMLNLNINAKLMLTDSGGLQEECCVLGTPCLTLRWNTERPVTLREFGGASVLVGNDVVEIRKEFFQTLTQDKTSVKPELWDGKTADRIVKNIIEYV